MSMQPRYYKSVHTKLFEKKCHICLIETAVTPLGDYVVAFLRLQFRDNFCPFSAFYGMISPKFKFMIYAFYMTIV
ncbi:hypothetical protein SDC9_157788 [bioreactor metagenome]|uniref:Uncharacterized protein n=1 Tax=bioreactor metagenome TaxID=1076179 RepID=A0A645FDM3_9ZZZZ